MKLSRPSKDHVITAKFASGFCKLEKLFKDEAGEAETHLHKVPMTKRMLKTLIFRIFPDYIMYLL